MLEDLRQSRLTVTPELIDALLRAVDVLRYFKEEIETGVPAHVETADLIRRLRVRQGPAGPARLALASLAGRGQESGPTNGTGARPEKLLRLSARIAGDSLVPAARALQILLALDEVGKVVWSQPEREAIERGQPLRELAVLVESELSAGQMPAHFKHISEIDSLDVKPAAELTGEAGEAPGETQEAEPEVEKRQGRRRTCQQRQRQDRAHQCGTSRQAHDPGGRAGDRPPVAPGPGPVEHAVQRW